MFYLIGALCLLSSVSIRRVIALGSSAKKAMDPETVQIKA